MTYRVIQWATGAQGTEAIRAILDRPDLELAGVKVYSEGKDGVDAGDLAGRAPTGVARHARHRRGAGDRRRLRRLLATQHLARRGVPHPRQRQERGDDRVPVPPRAAAGGASATGCCAACEAGGTSVHGTGLNPGNLSGVLPLALSGMSRTHRAGSPCRSAPTGRSTRAPGSRSTTCASVGRSTRSARRRSEFLRFNSGIFIEEVWLIGDALGAGLDEVTTDGRGRCRAVDDHDIFGIRLAAGTAAGQRWQWTGRRDGEPLVEIETLWTVGGEYPAALADAAARLDPHDRGRPVACGRMSSRWPASSARSPSPSTSAPRASPPRCRRSTAIPAVCAAAPGIATMADLPLVRSGRGFGNV